MFAVHTDAEIRAVVERIWAKTSGWGIAFGASGPRRQRSPLDILNVQPLPHCGKANFGPYVTIGAADAVQADAGRNGGFG